MFVKNSDNFNTVFSLLSTFKALPKELVLELSSITEDDFANLLKRKVIYQVGDNLYSVSRTKSFRQDLINLAWGLSTILPITTGKYMIISDNPLTCSFLVKSKQGSVRLACLTYVEEEVKDMVLAKDFSEFSAIFFVCEADVLSKELLKQKFPNKMIGLITPDATKNKKVKVERIS